MALQDKYKELLDTARSVGVTDLQAREQDNVLYIDGQAPSGAAKDQLWNVYSKLDPDFRTGEARDRNNVRTTAEPQNSKSGGLGIWAPRVGQNPIDGSGRVSYLPAPLTRGCSSIG